jgi:hypothetical protein
LLEDSNDIQKANEIARGNAICAQRLRIWEPSVTPHRNSFAGDVAAH